MPKYAKYNIFDMQRSVGGSVMKHPVEAESGAIPQKRTASARFVSKMREFY